MSTMSTGTLPTAHASHRKLCIDYLSAVPAVSHETELWVALWQEHDMTGRRSCSMHTTTETMISLSSAQAQQSSCATTGAPFFSCGPKDPIAKAGR